MKTTKISTFFESVNNNKWEYELLRDQQLISWNCSDHTNISTTTLPQNTSTYNGSKGRLQSTISNLHSEHFGVFRFNVLHEIPSQVIPIPAGRAPKVLFLLMRPDMGNEGRLCREHAVAMRTAKGAVHVAHFGVSEI